MGEVTFMLAPSRHGRLAPAHRLVPKKSKVLLDRSVSRSRDCRGDEADCDYRRVRAGEI